MHHNDVDFWRYLVSLPKGHADLPSPRICKLLQRVFQRWREKPLWLTDNDTGHLFLNRTDLTERQKADLAGLPLPIRKSRSILRMFEIICDQQIAKRCGTFSVDPDEIIIGVLPPFSVGQGKEFVNYLTKQEQLKFMLSYLNERSPMGHIVPDHDKVVTKGLRSLIKGCKEKMANADKKQSIYYQSVIDSLEAVIYFAHQYAKEAKRIKGTLSPSDPRIRSLELAANTLEKVPEQKAETFYEAVQSIFMVHCALHWTVEIVPLGRLDQILYPFYKNDIEQKRMTHDEAQEILDAFWIKLGERAILNRRHVENRFSACDGVLTGFFGPSNYDQGGLINQWMQQITIGGVVANNEEIAMDASNPVTLMCLESSRRLPLNSPTLDLRVHSGTPDTVLEHAAKALLSGGAHPVILNDDKIIAGLMEGAAGMATLSAARNYACDGCYETMFAGESEFSFGFVSGPDIIEKTINRGAGLAAAGPIHLLGFKDSWRTEESTDIQTWDEFWKLLQKHMLLSCHRYINNIFLNYGNKAAVCPSTLLSAFIGGCIESGRDLSDGGSRYHIFSPLLTGISTAADSLYVIKCLVYENKIFTLDELRTALATNWGLSMVEAKGKRLPALGKAISPERIIEIRALCNNGQKFGFGNKQVDQLAWDMINMFCDAVRTAWKDDVHVEQYNALQTKYNSSSHPFNIFLVPGVGTFEQYLFSGTFLGASADGRHAWESIASDLSPAPVHRDLPVIPENSNLKHARTGNIKDSFRSYADKSMERLGDGGPADYNLPEDFPVEELIKRLKEISKGQSGSIATFTVANPETFARAQENPDDYNLVRVRMGGWTEFFVALFPDHQEQHRRRPLFIN